ncbi:MAG: transketolase family protein [bacterium]
MRDCFIELLRQEALKNKDIMLLTGDLGFGVLNKYRDTLPEQFLNIGIAEQNMTGIATGLALEGYKAFTYSIGNFCTLRCLEQIRNDVCYHKADVKVVSVGSGLGYGSLGMSHHATEDVAIMRAIPNIKIYSPSDYSEICACVKDLVSTKGPGYVRLAKVKVNPAEARCVGIDTCNAVGSVTHSDLVLLTHGSMVKMAQDIIAKLGIPCDLYTIPQLKPLPHESLQKTLSGRRYVITLEEHNLCGGFGSSICEFLADNQIQLPVIRLGLPDQFISVGGTADELMAYVGLNPQNCVEKIKSKILL